MASHKGWDRSIVATSVLKDGRSLNLSRSKGQFGVVDMSSAPTKDGLKVISSFDGLDKDNKFQLRLGKAPISVNRSQSDKAWASETFKISNIVDLQVDAPKTQDFSTDEFIIGYNGFDADSALTFNNGDNEEIDIELYGKAMGILGYEKASVNFQIHLEAPNAGTFTNQEIVENAVERLKDITLVGGVPVTDYVEITPVNSENDDPLTGATAFAFYNLVLEDEGDFTALASVQSQFNDFKVERTDRSDRESTYTLVSTPGATIADYVKTRASKIKGCEDCPAGYDEFEDGFVYNILLEDDGADQSAAVEAISTNATAGSAQKVAQVEGGLGSYTVVISAELTDAEKAAFILAQPTATIELAAEDVTELCSPNSSVSTSWVEGESCNALPTTFTITLADDDCGANKLAALQEVYPDLTITVDSQNACQTRYTTTVLSNIVCEECDAEFRDLFSAEAPAPFELVEWVQAPKTYSETALMGIRLKAKEAILSGDEQFRDDLFFMATSTRMRVAGGYPTTVSESFNAGLNGRFEVKILSIGEEPENWGGDLREFEDIGKRYWEGVSRHEGNNYGKWILGEETNLDGTSPYVDYILTVRVENYAQSFSGLKDETFYYHIYVQPGLHTDVEDVLNALAAEAGISPVQAYGKTPA